jgi:hypothetical protein
MKNHDALIAELEEAALFEKEHGAPYLAERYRRAADALSVYTREDSDLDATETAEEWDEATVRAAFNKADARGGAIWADFTDVLNELRIPAADVPTLIARARDAEAEAATARVEARHWRDRMLNAEAALASRTVETAEAPKPENLEIVNGWLVERGAHEPEYPAGFAYGFLPYSDAEPLVRLDTLPGWPSFGIETAEKWELGVRYENGTDDFSLNDPRAFVSEYRDLGEDVFLVRRRKAGSTEIVPEETDR